MYVHVYSTEGTAWWAGQSQVCQEQRTPQELLHTEPPQQMKHYVVHHNPHCSYTLSHLNAPCLLSFLLNRISPANGTLCRASQPIYTISLECTMLLNVCLHNALCIIVSPYPSSILLCSVNFAHVGRAVFTKSRGGWFTKLCSHADGGVRACAKQPTQLCLRCVRQGAFLGGQCEVKWSKKMSCLCCS